MLRMRKTVVRERLRERWSQILLPCQLLSCHEEYERFMVLNFCRQSKVPLGKKTGFMTEALTVVSPREHGRRKNVVIAGVSLANPRDSTRVVL